MASILGQLMSTQGFIAVHRLAKNEHGPTVYHNTEAFFSLPCNLVPQLRLRLPVNFRHMILVRSTCTSSSGLWAYSAGFCALVTPFLGLSSSSALLAAVLDEVVVLLQSVIAACFPLNSILDALFRRAGCLIFKPRDGTAVPRCSTLHTSVTWVLERLLSLGTIRSTLSMYSRAKL